MRRALLALAALGCATAPARPAPAPEGTLALVLPDLVGRAVDVGAEQGKVRVVDFWATWCAPCREELPALAALERELGPRGLEVYAVSYDEERSAIAPFLASAGPVPQVLLDPGGERSAGPCGVRRLPTALVVDRHGRIRFAHEGYDGSTAAAQRREVESLLAEP
ncbi:MAG TPA: TlpA disulfide reductase family protein [Anaeromyxobacteraceae bacterium]|nr:TlpA disulfide reductase family protein [Anaeromyxobacteraceae bacterium]